MTAFRVCFLTTGEMRRALNPVIWRCSELKLGVRQTSSPPASSFLFPEPAKTHRKGTQKAFRRRKTASFLMIFFLSWIDFSPIPLSWHYTMSCNETHNESAEALAGFSGYLWRTPYRYPQTLFRAKKNFWGPISDNPQDIFDNPQTAGFQEFLFTARHSSVECCDGKGTDFLIVRQYALGGALDSSTTRSKLRFFGGAKEGRGGGNKQMWVCIISCTHFVSHFDTFRHTPAPSGRPRKYFNIFQTFFPFFPKHFPSLDGTN